MKTFQIISAEAQRSYSFFLIFTSLSVSMNNYLFNSSSNTFIQTVFYKSQTYLHNLRIEIGEYEVDMVRAPANCKD